jgi:hypothetical protein
VTKGPIWHFTTEVMPVPPKLGCEGGLSWTKVEPGSELTGDFIVKNIGGSLSELDWEVESWPTWGDDWTFTPSNGTDLTPEDGAVTVNVTVTAPSDPNEEFEGDIKVVNLEDSSNFVIIDVYLSTPTNQQSFVLLSKNFMISNLLNKLVSIKMLLQRFDVAANIATDNSVSEIENIEDPKDNFVYDYNEIQQSTDQYSEDNEQNSQNIDPTSPSDSSNSPEDTVDSPVTSEDDGSSEPPISDPRE